MPLVTGTRIGPHEILGPLGAGGMGEVYRATDTRLKRQVAVKILPPEVAADPIRLARFQREAELLAALNHPHIAAIYGVEESNSVNALVMELVDGPTLADRIARGPIPIDEALPIARQIAEALEAAHEQGIIHRDLKPANIKVRDDGTVKVLDFGLAKPRDGGADSSIDIGADIGATVSAGHSPTFAQTAVSQAGVILGTAAYMSPEQARGRTVDKRTDVWAFGAVLFEMLTGRRAFAGEYVSDIIAAVLKSTPDWTAIPADVPPHVVTLIQRCLDKDRQTRIGDVAVARFLLSPDAPLVAAAAATAPASVERRLRKTLPWVGAALAGGMLLGWVLPRRPSEPRPVTHLQMGVEPAAQIAVSTFAGERPARISIALSPDGRRLVFVGSPAGAPMRSQLYERTLDRSDAAPMPGTEGATAPFFSPDGAWIGFVADNKIKKAPAGGGAVSTICDVPAGAPFWGASWAEDDRIFFATRGGIFHVPSGGGTPIVIPVAERFKGDRQLLPQLLPGGKALLYTAPPDTVVVTLDTGQQRTLIEGGTDARYVDTGHLVYMRTGTLMALPFDVKSALATGPPVALIEGVMHGVNAGNGNDETEVGQFAISKSGTLVYALGGIVPNRQSTLMWVDRHGVAQPLPGASGRAFHNPRVSPDGRRIAVAIRRDGSRDTDLWLYDVERASTTRLTLDGGSYPLWSPDGTRVVYATGQNRAANLYMLNADGSGKPERLTTSDVPQTPASWSAGANAIAFMQRPTPDSFGIYVMAMDGPPAARKPSLFLESRVALTFPEFSPDGRWIAYVSTESGRSEVYVQPYPGPGAKVQVSTAFGSEPVWTSQGRELLFRSATQTVMPTFSAAIDSASPLHIGIPRLLFEAKNGEYDRTIPVRAWDVTPDGRRLLLVRNDATTDKPVTLLHVVLNWTDELKRRVPPQ
jgi:eukaryotic-like serine/threonine-protein kinase